MTIRRANLALIGIMVAVAIIILFSTLTVLYQTAFEQARENLARTVLSQARLLEAVAIFDQEHFDREHNSDSQGGSISATLSQIDNAFKSFEHIGETDEFLVARKQGDYIEFLSITTGGGHLIPNAVPFNSGLAEPMRRAVSGKGGTMIGQDYDDVTVLAAYQPVEALNFGIVVKIDIAEIRAPFLKTGTALILFSVILVAIGSALFFRINNPMILRIRESERRYQRAIAGTADGIWDWNIKTGFNYFSPRWAEILGYDLSDLKQDVATFTDLIHPDDRDLVWHHIYTHLEYKTPFDLEFRMRNKNGDYIWIQSKGSARRDKKGQPVFMAGAITDITNRKLTQDKLLKSEQHLKLYREQAPLAAIDWNTDFQIIGWNTAAEDMFGYSLAEVKGQNFFDIMLPESAKADVKQIWKDLIAQTGGTKSINENLTKEGHTILCEWHNTPLIDKSGTVIGAAALVLDITAQHKAQKTLLAKELEQREILDSMLDSVISIDETGSIVSFNKTAEALFGYSLDEVIGKNISLLMPNPDAHKHDDYLLRYLKTGDTRIIGSGREVMGLRKNKQSFPMRLSVAELPADEEGKRRFIGSCQDLTHVKQQEELLRRTQKMEALGKLTGGIAHDFNNILGIIVGYSDLIKDVMADQPNLSDYIDQIRTAGERGAKLTKKLLSFSSVQSSEATKLDINVLLKEQQDMLQKTLTVRINLIIEPGDDIWPIWLDSSDLENAIFNMSINAMHAITDNKLGARLTIRTENQSLNKLDALALGLKTGDYILLSLTDTGCGMNEATKEQIFDPFFTTKGDKGTGLGLSQVFGLVKRAGGIIKVYSEPGHGSNFVLYFPRYLMDDIEKPIEVSEDDMDLTGQENILVVDDEAALRDLTSELLEGKGYRVFCAEGGHQALEILKKEAIDLMLSDVIMPEMDGYQLATIVQEKYPAIKIQLASGFTDDRHMDMTDQSLHQNLLHKPYNARTLFENIRTLLNN